MRNCSICDTGLEITRVHCPGCGLTTHGTFLTPRVARLDSAQQALIEQIILAGGNLKSAGQSLKISYPTLRKRLDRLIGELRTLAAFDETRARAMEDQVAAGRMNTQMASRMISEMNGDA